MKPVFIYTAIGILLVVVLLQLYFMNEHYTDASGSVVDGSGNMISLSLRDLFYALRLSDSDKNLQKNTNTNKDTNKFVNKFKDSKNIDLSEETKSRIAKDITKTVKDSILSDRSLNPVNVSSCQDNSVCDSTSDSCNQGSDFLTAAPGSPFNMDDYIRKDSIPCYGCTLPK